MIWLEPLNYPSLTCLTCRLGRDAGVELAGQSQEFTEAMQGRQLAHSAGSPEMLGGAP